MYEALYLFSVGLLLSMIALIVLIILLLKMKRKSKKLFKSIIQQMKAVQ
jgi:uncharacterized protein YoxC